MRKLIHNMLTLGFVGYMILLLYFLFFSEEYGRTIHYTEYQYNFTLFREISRYIKYRDVVGIDFFLINVVGNVVVFMPFGFFVAQARQAPSCLHKMVFAGRKKKRGKVLNFFAITGLGLLFSLTVETVQLITKVGCFDVDDLLLNTIGVAFGYICYEICHIIWRRIRT